MSSPRIVVLCGAYNEERHLHETIPAILNQTMPDFRVYLVDNGSTDGSWLAMKELTQCDARVTLLRSPRNLPPPDAMNLGVHAAMQFWPDTKWFVGAGADDIMDADYLETILASAEANPCVNLIFSPMRFIDHPEKGIWRYPPYDAAHVHEKLMVPGWRAFTRELWQTVGPENVAIGPGSDWEWICRAGVMGALKPYQLPEPKLSLRIRDGHKRISQSYEADRPKLLKHMKAMADAKREVQELTPIFGGW